MKVHNVEIRVFSKPEDNIDEVEKGLLKLLPFDLDKEKIKLSKKNTYGFNERKIVIMEVKLNKQRHLACFFEEMSKMLSDDQKELLKREADSRLDDELFFYLRFDKEKLVKDKVIWLIDEGDCFHLKFAIASFPKTRENALNNIRNLF